MQTLFPEFVEEWINEKNSPDTVYTVGGGTKKYWWRCKKCGNEWLASIIARKRGTGCTHCAQMSRIEKKKKRVGQYDLRTGELIAVYDSVQEAEGVIHNKNIGLVCNGNRKSAGGFYWQHIE